MGKQPRIILQVADPENGQACNPSRLPVQHGIKELQKALSALNERIAELEDDGHQGHAMEVLKINAMDLARQIDELRCLLREFKQ
jgi:hypothetical protein